MKMEYKTEGTCSRRIFLELDGDTIKSVSFEGGCNGNLKGIGSLVVGMDRDDAINRLKGIRFQSYLLPGSACACSGRKQKETIIFFLVLSAGGLPYYYLGK